MTHPIRSSQGIAVSRDSRQLAALDRDLTLGIARINQRAQLEAAKAHAVAYVGMQGMNAVTFVSATQWELAQACPLAAARVQSIADMTALAVLQVVGDSVRKVSQ
jgi:hypothetical protein